MTKQPPERRLGPDLEQLAHGRSEAARAYLSDTAERARAMLATIRRLADEKKGRP